MKTEATRLTGSYWPTITQVLYYNIIVITMQVFGPVINFEGCFNRHLEKSKICKCLNAISTVSTSHCGFGCADLLEGIGYLCFLQ